MEIQTIEPFLRYFGNVRERTMRVARCVPPDKIDWSYAPGKFTLGDLLRHIAVAERFMWAETLSGRPSRYTSHGKELADGFEEIIAFMEQLHASRCRYLLNWTMRNFSASAKRPTMPRLQNGNGCG